MGLTVKTGLIFDQNVLPLYITDRYQMSTAIIGDTPVVFVTPKTDLEQTQTLKKHLLRIEKSADAYAVLNLKSISYYRRKTFIEAKIPFVIPKKQLYLPFIGLRIQQQADYECAQLKLLQPSAQALLLYFIYSHAKCLYISEAVQKLGYSAMTISRAASQLVDCDLMAERKDGVQKIIYTEYSGKDLFERALQYLTTPIKREIYVSVDKLPQLRLMSGVSALAEHSMLNPESPTCYGIYYKMKITGTTHLIDSTNQKRVQLWKYDPEWFREWTSNNTVDPLSLFLSLRDNPDERIEVTLKEYINNFWEKYDGHGY